MSEADVPLDLIRAFFAASETWERGEAWLLETPEADHLFVEALLAIADGEHMAGNPQGEQIAQHAFLAAEVRGTPIHRADARRLVAMLFEGTDRLAEADRLYVEAAEVYAQAGDHIRLARTKLSQTQLALRRGDMANAAAMCAEAAGLSRQGGDDQVMALAIYQQGQVAHHLHQPSVAERHYADAAAVSERIGDAVGLARVRYGQADLAAHTGRQTEATALFAQAAAICHATGDDLGLANARRRQGDLAAHDGRLEEADERYKEAARLIERTGPRVALADIRRAQADLAWKRGDPAQAVTLYAEAAELCLQSEYGLGLANVRRDQGQLAELTGNHIEAAFYYGQSADLFQRLRHAPGLGSIRRSQGMLAQRQGLLEKAASYFQEAIELHESVGDVQGLANARHCQANLAFERGHLEEARSQYAAADKLYRTVGDSTGLATNLVAEADLARHLGRLEEAVDRYARAGALYQNLGQKLGQGNVLRSQGAVAHQLGDVDAAAHLLQQAAELFREIGHTLGLANTRLNQGHLAHHHQRPEDADRLYEEAATLYRQIGHPLGVANAAHARAWLALQRGAHHQARALLTAGFEGITVDGTATGSPTVPSAAAQLLELLAHCYLETGEWREAWDHSLAALDVTRAVVGSALTASDRAAAVERGLGAVGTAVSAALAMAETADPSQRADQLRTAWNVAEEMKSQALVGLFAGSALRDLRLRPSEADPETQEILASLTQLEEASGQSPWARREELLALLWARNQRLAAIGGWTRISVGDVLPVLRGTNAALVSYARCSDDRFTAFVLGPDGTFTNVRLGQVTNTELWSLLARSGNAGPPTHLFSIPAVGWTRSEEQQVAALRGALWTPIVEAKLLDDVAHVFVVPDGWLRLVPFPALWSDSPGGRRYVVEEPYTISVLFTAGLLPHLASAARRAKIDADPAIVVDPACETVPVHPDVVASFERSIAPRRPLPRPTTGADFARAARSARAVIYLGHGTTEGLVFADGIYTAHRVYSELDAHGPAFLAACLIGLEHAFRGLQGASLVSAMQYAGCPAVLGALWSVNAAATSYVLAALIDDDSCDWASRLQSAQRILAANPDTADPCQWAGLTLFGLPGLPAGEPDSA